MVCNTVCEHLKNHPELKVKLLGANNNMMLHSLEGELSDDLLSTLNEELLKTFNKYFMRSNSKMAVLSRSEYNTQLNELENYYYNVIANNNKEERSVLFYMGEIDNYDEYIHHHSHHDADNLIEKVFEIKNESYGQINNNFFIKLENHKFAGFIYNEDEPMRVIDDFNNQLEMHSIEHNGNPKGICTVSLGIVECKNINNSHFTRLSNLLMDTFNESKNNTQNSYVHKTI